MPTTKTIPVPQPRSAGGSARGWSYFTTFKDCEWKFYLKYLHALAAQGSDHEVQGIDPRHTSSALLIGSLFHTGVETLYLSGWDGQRDTGNYDPDAAIKAAEEERDQRAAEWASEAQRDKDWALAASLISLYYQHYGPGGREQDYPGLKITSYQDRPALEIELAIDLEDELGSVFTSKFDAILEDQDGVIWGLEHKTSSASRAWAQLQKFFLDGQITGQYINLLAHYPDRQVGGVIINMVVKDAAKDKPRFRRQTYQRDEESIFGFLRSMKRDSLRIHQTIQEWKFRTDGGKDPWDAALATFDTNPPADRCVSTFKCDFYDVCLNRNLAKKVLVNDFIPKIRRDVRFARAEETK